MFSAFSPEGGLVGLFFVYFVESPPLNRTLADCMFLSNKINSKLMAYNFFTKRSCCIFKSSINFAEWLEGSLFVEILAEYSLADSK